MDAIKDAVTSWQRCHAEHRPCLWRIRCMLPCAKAVCTGCGLHLQNAEGLLDQALRVFGLVGALLVAVVEIELETIISLVRFTEYWSGRAIVQVCAAGQRLQAETFRCQKGPVNNMS